MTHRDDSGEVQVDFVWGNFPMQPDDDRLDSTITIGGGYGDVGWSQTYKYLSDTLRTSDYYLELNNLEYRVSSNHINADLGYSNFPGYIPNYAGDEDSGLETIVPDLLRKTISEAGNLVDAANLDIRVNYHNPSIFYLESTGTTVRVFAYDEDASGAGYPEAYLVGLRAGDQVYVDNSEYNFETQQTITKVNEDGENSWFEFETATALELDTSCNGTVWPGDNVYNKVMMMRGWNQPGSIKDEGTNIYVRALGD